MMEMQPIQMIKPLWDNMPVLSGGGPEKPAAGDTLFGDVFRSAIENVRQTEADKTDKEYLLAVGELDNPAELSIAATKYQLSVDMLVQLRNKALDAYSEVMRISL